MIVRIACIPLLACAVGCFNFDSLKIIDVGGRCGDGGHLCHADLRCVKHDGKYVCVRDGGGLDGEKCSLTWDMLGCSGDLGCVNGVCHNLCTDIACGLSGTCVVVSGASTCAWTGAEPCSNDNECMTGFCRDGMCCQSGCDGLCMSCSAALNGVADGTCSSTLDGLKTGDECWGPLACNGRGFCYDGRAGMACVGNFSCVTGVCNGACCEAPCDGACKSCAVAGSLGQCMDVPAGDDPRGECPGSACNGHGRCEIAQLGSACNDDSDCANGAGDTSSVCCGGTCHRWHTLNIPLASGDAISQPWTPNYGPVFGLQDGTALVAVEHGTPGTSAYEMRVMEYDGTTWQDLGLKGLKRSGNGPRIRLAAGSHQSQIFVSFEDSNYSNHDVWYFDNETKGWLVLRNGIGLVAVATIDNENFYLSFNNGEMVATGPRGSRDVVLPSGLQNNSGAIASRGGIYVLDISDIIVPYRLDGLTPIPLSWSWSATDNHVAWRIFSGGVAGSPGYLQYISSGTTVHWLELTETGFIEASPELSALLVANQNPSFAGSGPSVFVPSGQGVSWSLDQKAYKFTQLSTAEDVIAVHAGGACSAFAVTATHVYGF